MVLGKGDIIKSFLLHIHPAKVKRGAIRTTRTFGLGGINALLFLILAVTGLLLRFHYVPFPDEAYGSILTINNSVLFGRLIRNIHYLSATLMVIVSFLHLLRVFYTQSYYGVRGRNWVYGLVLFVIVLLFNFTGYLLPWDQLSYWAVTIMTELVEYFPFVGNFLASMIRGGDAVDGTTLLNFYSMHTGVLPLLIVGFMIVHFWLVRKAGGVMVPQNEDNERVDVNPNLIKKEKFVALAVIAIVFLGALFINAPLQAPANPAVSPNPSKAPWYFIGIQEFLLHVHPIVAVFIAPVILLGLFIYLPDIKLTNINFGVWFNSKQGRQVAVNSALFSAILTIALILVSDIFMKSEDNSGTWIYLFIMQGIVPLLMYIIPVWIFMYAMRKKTGRKTVEQVIALITIIIVSYIIMMLTGLYFRGEGMHLIFLM